MKRPMTCSRRGEKSAHRRGFTLLEILIATAVSGIVLLVVQGVFFGALKLRNATDRRIAEDRPLQRTLDTVAADLRGLRLTGDTLAGEFQTDPDFAIFTSSGEGTPIGPTFTTTNGRIDARTSFSEVQRISYRLLGGSYPAAGYTLLRTVERNLLTTAFEEPLAEALLDHVTDAGFEYFDGTSWIEYWDSATSETVPTAVRFWVQVAPPGVNGAIDPLNSNLAPAEIVVPIFVANAAATEASSI
jgi:type II secretion system protein J